MNKAKKNTKSFKNGNYRKFIALHYKVLFLILLLFLSTSYPYLSAHRGNFESTRKNSVDVSDNNKNASFNVHKFIETIVKSNKKTSKTTASTGSSQVSPSKQNTEASTDTAAKTAAAGSQIGSSRPVIKPVPASSVSNLKPVSPDDTPSTATSPTQSQTEPSSVAPTSSNTKLPVAQPGVSSYESTNWAGYITAANNITAISGSWIVPAATSTGQGSTDATWVGIGGITTKYLIQAGTVDSFDYNGNLIPEAFYEILPGNAITIPSYEMSISPGDVITSSITLVSGDEWSITITNQTDAQNFSVDVDYSSSVGQSSTADWIEEDPTNGNTDTLLPLDNFTAVYLSNLIANINGNEENLSQSQASPIFLINSQSNEVLISPSVLNSTGDGFNAYQDQNSN